jgi:superfamily I DNA/RNA helicase
MEAGAPPILIYSDSPQDAIDRVTNEVAAIAEQEQLPMSSLLVIHGNKVDAFTLFQKLGNRIGPDRIWWMNGKEHKKAPPKGYGQDYLRLARLETATGLEATVVFLVGIEDLLSDADLPGLRDDEQARRREGNARKLFMAMTRAGQRLALISSQRAPEAIERVFEQRP